VYIQKKEFNDLKLTMNNTVVSKVLFSKRGVFPSTTSRTNRSIERSSTLILQYHDAASSSTTITSSAPNTRVISNRRCYLHTGQSAMKCVHNVRMITHRQQQEQKQCRHIHVEKRLSELGIQLPKAPTPKANYNIICYTTGNIMYLSGHLPIRNDGTLITGSIGPAGSSGESIEHGYNAARQVGLNIIATLKEQLGDLDRVEQIVKVRGLENIL
jgi:enamine deaminase RidA (YjgF/YER057c/UK114 family)